MENKLKTFSYMKLNTFNAYFLSFLGFYSLYVKSWRYLVIAQPHGRVAANAALSTWVRHDQLYRERKHSQPLIFNDHLYYSFTARTQRVFKCCVKCHVCAQGSCTITTVIRNPSISGYLNVMNLDHIFKTGFFFFPGAKREHFVSAFLFILMTTQKS